MRQLSCSRNTSKLPQLFCYDGVFCFLACLFCLTLMLTVLLCSSPLSSVSSSQRCAGSANLQAGGLQHSSWKRDQKSPIPVCVVHRHVARCQAAWRDAHIPKPRWDAGYMHSGERFGFTFPKCVCLFKKLKLYIKTSAFDGSYIHVALLFALPIF